MKQSLTKVFIFLALFLGTPSLASSAGHLPRCSDIKAVRCILVDKWDGVWDENVWIGEAYRTPNSSLYRHIGVWLKDGKIYKEGKFSGYAIPILEKAYKTPYSSPPYHGPSSKLKKLFATYSQIKRKRIQTNLAFHGYYKSKVDGLYGKGTAAALKAYNKEYLGDADLTKSSNVKALLNDLLKERRAEEEAEPKVTVTLNLGSDGLKVELGSGEAPKAEVPAAPPLDFPQLKASYDAGNFTQAFKDAQILSVEGNPDAQLYLGKMYADGRGTLQVTTSAHMWFNIASMNGSDEAFDERKAIQSQMTPELINEAQKMAVACIKSDYKDCGLLVQPSDTKKAAFKMLRPTGTDLRSYFVGEPAIRRKQMQYALKKLGYYNSAIDGLYGNRTQTALQSYLFESESVSSLNHLYDRLVSEVDVPAIFPSRQQANKVKQQRNKVIASSQGYSKAQAQAICEPKARLAGLQASSSFSPSNSVVNCVNGGSFGFRCSEGLSGGAWGGVLAAIEEKEIEQDAYDAVMEACMVNLGWY